MPQHAVLIQSLGLPEDNPQAHWVHFNRIAKCKVVFCTGWKAVCETQSLVPWGLKGIRQVTSRKGDTSSHNCTSLDGSGMLQYPKEIQATQGEHANSTHKAGVEFGLPVLKS